MNRATYLLVAVTAAWTSAAPAFAADAAPLPDGFESEATSTVPGLYAHGVRYDDRYRLDQFLEKAQSACRARGRSLEYRGDRRRTTGTEYWLYRTGNDTVVFESDYDVRIDADQCEATFTETRKVSRSTEKPGTWPAPFHGGRGCPWYARACYTDRKFGLKQRCRSEGNGFQGTTYCVSIDRGLSRGLLLDSSYWSDDMSGSGFNITDVKDGAILDAALFDRTREW